MLLDGFGQLVVAGNGPGRGLLGFEQLHARVCQREDLAGDAGCVHVADARFADVGDSACDGGCAGAGAEKIAPLVDEARIKIAATVEHFFPFTEEFGRRERFFGGYAQVGWFLGAARFSFLGGHVGRSIESLLNGKDDDKILRRAQHAVPLQIQRQIAARSLSNPEKTPAGRRREEGSFWDAHGFGVSFSYCLGLTGLENVVAELAAADLEDPGRCPLVSTASAGP